MKVNIILFTFFVGNALVSITQGQTNKNEGTIIITSGGKIADSLFISLLGSQNAKLIIIPTAASSLRSDNGIIWNPDKLEKRRLLRQKCKDNLK